MVRKYKPSDEDSWCRCRVLSFLRSSYFDDVLQAKPTYQHPSVELVFEEDHTIVGLLDIEWEETPGSVCQGRAEQGAMIWNLAVHPDHQRRNIASSLLEEALAELSRHHIAFIDAWTRDDVSANAWYTDNGFETIEEYVHAYYTSSEAKRLFSTSERGLVPVHVFAHLVGDVSEIARKQASRWHACRLYRRELLTQAAR